MLTRDNNHSTCSGLEWKACFSSRCKFIPEILKNVSYPAKKMPDLDQSKIKFLDSNQKYT